MADDLRTGRNQPEPPPKDSDAPAVWDLVLKHYGHVLPPDVVEDIEERDRAGKAKYGTRLRLNNGRDPRIDLYQELLDALVYASQWMFEQDDDWLAEHIRIVIEAHLIPALVSAVSLGGEETK